MLPVDFGSASNVIIRNQLRSFKRLLQFCVIFDKMCRGAECTRAQGNSEYSVAALQNKGFAVSSPFLIVGDYLSCSSPLSSDVGSTVAQIVRS